MTAVLWSGGKDSFLALLLHHAVTRQPLNAYHLVTFVPPHGVFYCHPMRLLERQAAMLGAAHKFISIDSANWLEDYASAFRSLRRHVGVKEVISGDAIFTSKAPDGYWLDALIRDEKMKLTLPLCCTLGAEDCLKKVAEFGLNAVVTGVHEAWHRPGFLGNTVSLQRLMSLGLYDDSTFDLLGERGEYHTSVVGFDSGHVTEVKARPHARCGSVWHLAWEPHWLNPVGARHSPSDRKAIPTGIIDDDAAIERPIERPGNPNKKRTARRDSF